MIVLGGNTAVFGSPLYGDKWLIGIPRTDNDAEFIGYMKLSSGEATTTSAGSGRKLEKGGRVYGHIIDPRTGSSAQSDLAYTTVVSTDGAEGDALSTALYIMGSKKAAAFLKANPRIKAFLMLEGGRTAYVTKSASETIFVKPSEVTLIEI